MSNLPFTKMQAVGNDFVVVETSHWPSASEWESVAVRLCDRHFGIGADGLLVFCRSERADFRMRMFNPDGTEDMCGNGLRCIIRYARAQGLYTACQGVAETLDGLHPFTVDAEDRVITVKMGIPHFALAEIPIDVSVFPEGVRQTLTYERMPVSLPGSSELIDAINTGSTHSVLWRDEFPDDPEFFRISPQIEHAPAFPERTSVLWATVEGRNAIRLRIWERGAGETLGCGTGACAAAVLARRSNQVSAEGAIAVRSKGGELTVDWAGNDTDPMYLSGPAHIVFQGYWHGES